MEIRTAKTEIEIENCFPVMKQLRPHLTLEKFVAQVLRQMQAYGYSLIYAMDHGEITAASGFRVSEFLAWGKTLFIDDLIADEGHRLYLNKRMDITSHHFAKRSSLLK